MIRSIRLARFGRFVGAQFALGPVTLFLGPNESGKSTLVDALVAALCRPDARTLAGKRLRERYGSYEQPEVSFDGEPIAFEAEEFLNLFAIREGGFRLELGREGGWLERVKSALFSGGLDPNRLAAALEAEADQDPRRRHTRQYRAKEEQLERIRRDLAELQEERARLLESQRRLEEQAAHLAALEQRIEEASTRRAALEAELARHRRAKERDLCRGILADIKRAEAARAAIARLASTAEEEKTLAELEGRLEQAREKRAEAKTAESRAVEEYQRAERAAGEAEEQRRRAAEVSALAAELRRELERSRRWRVVGALASAALLAGAAAAAAFAALGPDARWAWALAFGLAAGAAAGFLLERAASRAALERTSSEWKRRGGPGELRGGSWAELWDELIRHEGSADRARELAEARAAELEARREALAEATRERVSAEQEWQRYREEQEEWLRLRGAASTSEYRERRAQGRVLREQLAELERRLEQARQAYGCADDVQLETELARRLRESEAVGTALPDAEAKRLEAELDSLQKRLDADAREREQLKGRLDRESGVVTGSFGDLPERIVAAERALDACRRELAEMERARKAASLARDIFAEIARSSDVLMEELASEVSSVYGDLVGETRGVTMSAFDWERVRVVDASGEARDMEALSSGTRDLFLLAARLVLAGRARSGEGLIVLDEPFQAVDVERAGRVLALLRRFHEQRNWQILILSKDEALEGICVESFPQAVVHRLRRPSAGGQGRASAAGPARGAV